MCRSKANGGRRCSGRASVANISVAMSAKYKGVLSGDGYYESAVERALRESGVPDHEASIEVMFDDSVFPAKATISLTPRLELDSPLFYGDPEGIGIEEHLDDIEGDLDDKAAERIAAELNDEIDREMWQSAYDDEIYDLDVKSVLSEAIRARDDITMPEGWAELEIETFVERAPFELITGDDVLEYWKSYYEDGDDD